jgi:RNA polymerase sigma-70 factor, ECF subfamily
MTFREAVEQNQQMAYSLAYRFLGNEDDARDIVQEAFIRVWKHWDRYHKEMRFSTWLYKIVTNLCLDHIRSFKRRETETIEQRIIQRLASQEPAADEILDQAEKAEMIRSISGELPSKQQMVFVLRDLQDLEMTEVCGISGMNPSQVKANLYMARKYIRDRILSQISIKTEEL